LDQNTKLVVGRNKDENEMINALALPNDILLEAKEYVGPTVLLRGDSVDKHVEFSASVTLRYSDAPKNETCVVTVHKNKDVEISAKSAEEPSYTKLRI
jgi:predicted ribosome quality control (RQC) complex YloA/Tae2 family protein